MKYKNHTKTLGLTFNQKFLPKKMLALSIRDWIWGFSDLKYFETTNVVTKKSNCSKYNVYRLFSDWMSYVWIERNFQATFCYSDNKREQGKE